MLLSGPGRGWTWMPAFSRESSAADCNEATTSCSTPTAVVADGPCQIRFRALAAFKALHGGPNFSHVFLLKLITLIARSHSLLKE